MPADFSEPPASGLFEATGAEPTAPTDADFLPSLIIDTRAQSGDDAAE